MKKFTLKPILRASIFSSILIAASTAVNVPSLFAAQPGRSGAFYGGSYSELIAQNREALGPELSPYANGFTSLSGITGVGASVALVGTELVITSTSNDGADRGELPISGLIQGDQYLVELLAYRGVQGTQQTIRTSTALSINTVGIAGNTAPGQLIVIPTYALAASGVLRLYSSDGSGAIGDQLRITSISIKRIDLAKCVLFHDNNGTLPIMSVQQTDRGIGLLLDQSKGLALGPNTFNDNNVTFTGGSSRVSPGVYRIYSADGTYSLASGPGFATVVGKWYEVKFTIDSITTPSTGLQIESVENSSGTTIAPVVGYKRLIVRASATAIGIKRASGPTDIQISDISIKELPGNHRVQATAAARGELSAKYNQAIASEDVINASWTKTGLVATANNVLREDSSNGYHQAYQGFAFPAGASVTFRVDLKANGRTKAYMGGNWALGSIMLDLTNGVITGAQAGKVTSTPLGDGWYSYIFTDAVPDAAFRTYAFRLINSASTDSYAGDNISGILVRNYDVRLTADAIPSIPSYQRVGATSTDYDTEGFPVYWRAQTNDWGKAFIDPAGATKSVVLWAGQKMSETATSMVVETSTNLDTSNGGFRMTAPGSAGVNEVAWVSKGTNGAVAQTTGMNAYDTPARLVVAGVGDLAGDVSQLWLNGAIANQVATDQGTGTYTAQDVYFAARAGTTAFANMREFAPPLILFMQPADPGLSSGELTRLQRKYAAYAGVSI